MRREEPPEDKQVIAKVTFMVMELGSKRARSISSTLSCKATSWPLRRGLHATEPSLQSSEQQAMTHDSVSSFWFPQDTVVSLMQERQYLSLHWL